MTTYHCIFWRQRSYHVKIIERIVQYPRTLPFISFIILISMIFEPPANNEQETVIETFSYQTFNDCKHRIIFRVKRHTIQFNTLKIEKQMDCRKEELGGTRQWSSLQPWYLFLPFLLIATFRVCEFMKIFLCQKKQFIWIQLNGNSVNWLRTRMKREDRVSRSRASDHINYRLKDEQKSCLL